MEINSTRCTQHLVLSQNNEDEGEKKPVGKGKEENLRASRAGHPTKLLIAKEVAELIRRPIRSLYELIKERKIQVVIDGRRYKFRPEDVEAYIVSNLASPSKSLPRENQHTMPTQGLTPRQNRR